MLNLDRFLQKRSRRTAFSLALIALGLSGALGAQEFVGEEQGYQPHALNPMGLNPDVEAIARAQQNEALLQARIREARARAELQALDPTGVTSYGDKPLTNLPLQGRPVLDDEAIAKRVLELIEIKQSANQEVEVEATEDEQEITNSQPIVLPTVVAIFGSGKSMYATLRQPDGLVVDVQAGDHLSDGFRVAGVSINEVRLRKAGSDNVIRLRAGSIGTQAAQPDVKIADKALGINPMQGAIPFSRGDF